MNSNESNEPDTLTDWNRLNIENTENKLVSVIYENIIESTSLIESYSTWLTAGTAATVGLLITNVSTILPFLTATGFKTTGLLLVASILCGVCSKFFAIQCFIADKQSETKTQKVSTVMAAYQEDVRKIEALAKQQGRTLSTDLNMVRVLNTFSTPFPWWFKRFILPRMIRGANNPHAGYLIPLRFYRAQCISAFLQVIVILAGSVTAFIYSQNI